MIQKSKELDKLANYYDMNFENKLVGEEIEEYEEDMDSDEKQFREAASDYA